jgi:hypothetical protein
MDTPVLPKPEYLTLPEAVALVCPPLPEAGVQRTIEEALCDGRLSEEPRTVLSTDDSEVLSAALKVEGPDFTRAYIAQFSSPAHYTRWQRRFRDSRVDWRTGAVATAAGRYETPVFSRRSILALFGTAAVTSSPPRRTRQATQRPDVERALRELYPSGKPANRKAVLKVVCKKIGCDVSSSTFDRACKAVWPDA